MSRSENADSTRELLKRLLGESGIAPLAVDEEKAFELFLSLFIRWNSRINLSSVRDPEGIVARHFIESIACARHLPQQISTLLDFGSGGGFPGIPIAICRPDIRIALAESQSKKSAFLQECVRTLGLAVEVFAGRAEKLNRRFDCATLRAVDNMEDAVSAGAQLVDGSGWLAVMTTTKEVNALMAAAGRGFTWQPTRQLPLSENRVLLLGQRQTSLPA